MLAFSFQISLPPGRLTICLPPSNTVPWSVPLPSPELHIQSSRRVEFTSYLLNLFTSLSSATARAQATNVPLQLPTHQLPHLLSLIHCQHGRRSDFLLTYRSQTPLLSINRCLPRPPGIKSKFPVQVFLLWPPPYFGASLLATNPDSTSGTLCPPRLRSTELSLLSGSRVCHISEAKRSSENRFPLGDWSGRSDLPTLRGWDVDVNSPHVKGKCLLAAALCPHLQISL